MDSYFLIFYTTFARGFGKTTYEIRLHLGIEQALCTRFALIFQAILKKPKNEHERVLYGQLPRNPPGWERSKGTWL